MPASAPFAADLPVRRSVRIEDLGGRLPQQRDHACPAIDPRHLGDLSYGAVLERHRDQGVALADRQ